MVRPRWTDSDAGTIAFAWLAEDVSRVTPIPQCDLTRQNRSKYAVCVTFLERSKENSGNDNFNFAPIETGSFGHTPYTSSTGNLSCCVAIDAGFLCGLCGPRAFVIANRMMKFVADQRIPSPGESGMKKCEVAGRKRACLNPCPTATYCAASSLPPRALDPARVVVDSDGIARRP
ncbi:MAG TPA: hypothetical protein VFH12_02570, partial [Pseudoxanthomonas sp.]|nr:hypothetical protein [Pseudoxanthomonas sp.]